MIEIRSSLPSNKKTLLKKKPTAAKSSPTNFDELLNNQKALEQTKRTPSSANIQLLISELNHSGENLKNAPSLKNFIHYKMVVEKIFKNLNQGVYQIKKITFIDKKNFTQKELHLIKVVNLELKSLLSLISAEQKSNLSLAAKIVKIKGLLLEHLT